MSTAIVGSITGTAQAAPATVTVEVHCDTGSIVITSSKNISNVVTDIEGGHTKYDNLTGNTYVLPYGDISTVWVKSGNNHSGDGPGYGKRFDIPADQCAPADADGDGYPADVDCDDTDADINPGAVDIPNNGIDENCDGADLIVTEGELRITLRWDTDDDLDLYVTDPNGDQVSYFNIMVASGGTLDRDDNVGQCAADPEPGGVENTIWPVATPPPSGTYTVELSSFNDCDLTVTANYTIDVFVGGVLLTTKSGTTNSSGFGSANIVDSLTFDIP